MEMYLHICVCKYTVANQTNGLNTHPKVTSTSSQMGSKTDRTSTPKPHACGLFSTRPPLETQQSKLAFHKNVVVIFWEIDKNKQHVTHKSILISRVNTYF